MNLRDLPAEYDAFERYNVEYEAAHYRFTEANHRVGSATRDMFLSWFPRFTHPLVRRVIYAMMDEPILIAFGFPHPSGLLRRLVAVGLKLRGSGPGCARR